MSATSEGVQMLSSHLARVKLEYAEKEHAMGCEIKSLRQENGDLAERVSALEDMLAQRDFELEQTKSEMSRKWRIQEREDWKQLVTRLQNERSRLARANEDLQRQVAELQEYTLEHASQLAAGAEGRPKGAAGEANSTAARPAAAAPAGAAPATVVVLPTDPQQHAARAGAEARGAGEGALRLAADLRAQLAAAEDRRRHEVAQRDSEIRRLQTALAEAHADLEHWRRHAGHQAGGLQGAITSLVSTLTGFWAPKRSALAGSGSALSV